MMDNNAPGDLELCAVHRNESSKETETGSPGTNWTVSVLAPEQVTQTMTPKIYPEHMSYQWFEILILIVCAFGIVGNLLNLSILTRRRLRARLDKLGQTANHGLVALAVSDLLFCVVVLPHAFFTAFKLPGDELWYTFWKYYKVHGIASINLFMMISTWLIVTMAVKRYFVVVDPLHARELITNKRTCSIIALVYFLSAVFTLPQYLHLTLTPCSSLEGVWQLQHVSRWNDDVTYALQMYIRWIWPIIADFIPIAILLVCNCRLVAELKSATLNRRTSCPGQVVNDGGQRITLILVIIVLMLLLLVAPSEIIRYINPYRTWGHTGFVVAMVTNLLQTINFAFNFLLYFIVSTKFRQTAKTIVRFRCSPTSSGAERYPLAGNEIFKTESYRKCSSTKTWLTTEDVM